MKHTYTSSEMSNAERPSTGGVASGMIVSANAEKAAAMGITLTK